MRVKTLSMDSENRPSEKLSSSELLSSASRFLSLGILESPWWNLTTHPPTLCEKSCRYHILNSSKVLNEGLPEEFDDPASLTVTDTQKLTQS